VVDASTAVPKAGWEEHQVPRTAVGPASYQAKFADACLEAAAAHLVAEAASAEVQAAVARAEGQPAGTATAALHVDAVA